MNVFSPSAEAKSNCACPKGSAVRSLDEWNKSRLSAETCAEAGGRRLLNSVLASTTTTISDSSCGNAALNAACRSRQGRLGR